MAAVEQAEARAKQAQTTLDQLKDQYRRLQADFDNFRSRADQEKKQTGKSIKKGVLQDMLPLIDNFESAATKVCPSFPVMWYSCCARMCIHRVACCA